ncbi:MULTISPECIES: molybdenum cofactor biosynthesis protein B [Acinetobacter calcoaceticus/baumannii complex]|uniref:molybdenum cofactor biosynthesis protein B n=1 Tax=Acinetobacter TaxID=469 RepID=UPI00041A54A3|nr:MULTISPECIES: molybdenum cofactor biosynthesis protein B [Acinetobacter calcoaceticus/baumannii complex]MDC4998581.1 molybdenum cofactor biosynthesis protein B [Acinetobacter baumannii]MDC5145651.1 molybdenum cofactor biosynthesis protein B [Acinetobacter baumannii]MDC5188093.1 molybdenum cofactor biosynthesis protein B [Acinetobacter baumannii]MDC5307462.1 molybdenum cofactor biosynthesis protein B [Acinetobacter baumannii]RSP34321.1 molybdenum cofactor biosynthesis protein B [Acinetobacte
MKFQALNIAILTISDTRTFANDKSGDYLEAAVIQAGHQVLSRQISIDDRYQIRSFVSQFIADAQISVILITGGTGFYDRDITPEAVSVLFDKSIDGFGEVFRAISMTEIGMATIQSRALAEIANHTGIFCLPGSTNACKTAWEKILKDQLDATTRPCNFVEHFYA